MKLNKTLIVLGLALTLSHTSTARAIDWKHSLAGYVTRCFEMSKITFGCDDLSDPEKGTPERAELSIHATDFNGNQFFYGYLQGIEGSLCQEHLRKIRKVSLKAQQACITGWDESVIDDESIAHWSRFETQYGSVDR